MNYQEMTLRRNSTMLIIKFNFENGDMGSYDFPITLQEIKEWFPTGSIQLLENNTVPWLRQRNGQFENIYDLNSLSALYESLNRKERDKLNAISTLKPNLSINELIHHIKHLNHFGLINTFEDFSSPVRLAQELYQQQYPNGLANQSLTDEEWSLAGIKVKESLNYEMTSYGWLFKFNEPLPEMNKDEIQYYSRYEFESLIQLKAYNRETHQFIKLPIWLPETMLEQNLLRLRHAHLDYFEYAYENIGLRQELWEVIHPLTTSSSILEINRLLAVINHISLSERQLLESVLNHIQVDEISQLEFLIDSLYKFNFIETKTNSPYDFARAKLQMLLDEDFESYQAWVEGFVDYEKLGQAMLNEEVLVETEKGYLQVPDEFEHFFEDHMLEHKL